MTAMPVHPQIQQVIDALAASEFRPIHEQTPAQVRTQYKRMIEARGVEPAPVGTVEDRSIPDPAGGIPVRICRPAIDSTALPGLVYYHGGGHVMGDIDTHDSVARNLCNGAGCVVVSVDYRLAPEHKFPAAADEAFAALQWCATHAPELGIDPGRIAVGGDSAGGNLAAVAALMARDVGGPAIRLQVLVYPVTDYTCDTGSYHTYARGYGALEADSMRWFRDHYLRDETDRHDWRAAPLHAGDLSDLPPALVLTAQCDVLHDEGKAYAQRLREAGADVEYVDCEGMIHGFFTMTPMIDGAVRAQALVCDAMTRAFSAND